MRRIVMTGKTVDEAVEAACTQLGVSRDDLNVTYQVLEMPVRKLFKSVPARVEVTVEEEETPAAPETAPVQEVAPAVEEAAPAPAPVEETPAPQPEPAAPVQEEAAAPEQAPAEEAAEADEETEVPLDIENDPRLSAAVAYLTEVFAAMGVTGVEFHPVQKGEATILHVTGGKQVSALIGRRGETMEALSYLASLVANRLGGDYMKLGLDVAGYRNKREADLEALAKRLSEKVIRTGRSIAVEPMNPYERRIIHSAVGKIEGVRSESEGDGADRRVVIYSTDPNASNVRDRSSERRAGGRGPRRDDRRYGSRNGGRYNSNRGPRREGGRRFNDRRTSVPTRNFSEVAPGEAAPVAPKRAERINDADGLALYGKIEL